MEIKYKGYTLIQEVLLKSLFVRKIYIELGYECFGREEGKSRFSKLRNIIEIIKMLIYSCNQKKLKGVHRSFSRKPLS